MSETTDATTVPLDDADETVDGGAEARDATTEEDDLAELDDMEFMLDEIENRIAPLA